MGRLLVLLALSETARIAQPLSPNNAARVMHEINTMSNFEEERGSEAYRARAATCKLVATSAVAIPRGPPLVARLL